MTSMIAKYVTKRILKESAQNNFGQEDPYFETVPATRLDGRPTGKMKKRRKALPPGISEHDGKVLTKVKRRAYHLDMGLFSCCGIRFGWGSVIGLFPFAGDALDALLAFYVMRTCDQIEGGLPPNVRMQMWLNIILDFAVGLIPFVGDMADAVFKANTRNAIVLEKHLRKKGADALKAQGQSHNISDPSDPAEFDQNIDDGPPPSYVDTRPQRTAHRDPAYPAPSKPPTDRRGGFGHGNTEPDIERGDRVPLQDRPTGKPDTSRKNRR